MSFPIIISMSLSLFFQKFFTMALANLTHISIVRGYLFPIPGIPSIPNNLRIPVQFVKVLLIIMQMSSNMNYEEIVDFVKNQKGFHDM